jgi:hypothetical protein
VGAVVNAPADAVVIDATGRFVTPGVIDTHSHLGVYASPACRPTPTATRRRSPTPPRCGPSTRCGRTTPASRGAGGRRHHDADPPRLGQPLRRAERDAQERARRARCRG